MSEDGSWRRPRGRRTRSTTSRGGPGRCPTSRGRRRRPGTTSSSPTGRSPLDELARLLPPELAADTFDGEAWLGIVRFRRRGPAPARPAAAARALVVPAARGLHVRHGGRPAGRSGSSRSTIGEAAARGGGEARAPAAGLPGAHHARTTAASLRRDARRARVLAALPRRSRERHRRPGTLEHFLTERYCLYTADGGRLYRAELHHAPWRLRAADGEVETATIAPVAARGRRRTRSSPPRRTCSSGRWRSSLSPQRRTALVSVRRGGCAGRAEAHRRPRGPQPRSRLGGGPLGHRPRRGAAHLLRARRRGPAGGRRAPVRPRQGRAPGRARRGGVPRRSRACSSASARDRAARSASTADGARDLVRLRDRRRRDRGRREPRERLAGASSQRHASAALASNALHFASDLAGSIAVLVGLLLVAGRLSRAATRSRRSSSPCSCSLAAARLIRGNIDVLMDRAPAAAEAAARAAIAELGPTVELRRLRMRQAGGRQFADVVIGVPPVGRRSARVTPRRTRSRRRSSGRCRAATSSCTSSRSSEADLRERAHAAAAAVPGVREIHNLALVEVDGRTELSLHLKLPGDMTLAEAHDVAERARGGDQRRPCRRSTPSRRTSSR